MKIGSVTISGTAVLAPLAGVTDIPFRVLCRRFGASAVFSEMVSSEGLVRGSEKSNRFLEYREEERPVALQLFGSDPEVMGQAARIVEERKPDLIDLNFGCPVKKIVRNNAGSALLKDPPLMGRIVRSVVSSVSVPVTAKIRTGWDESSLPVAEIGSMLQDSGVSAITLHARTRSMQFSGSADWSEIHALKQAVSVPVIGNGDVRTPEDAQNMTDRTGCDLVMIGRGALGNPWIFRDVEQYNKTGKVPVPPSYHERLSVCCEQFEHSCSLYGERITRNTMKKHIGWYLKGIPGSTKVKVNIFMQRDAGKILSLLREFQGHFVPGKHVSGKDRRKAG